MVLLLDFVAFSLESYSLYSILVYKIHCKLNGIAAKYVL